MSSVDDSSVGCGADGVAVGCGCRADRTGSSLCSSDDREMPCEDGDSACEPLVRDETTLPAAEAGIRLSRSRRTALTDVLLQQQVNSLR